MVLGAGIEATEELGKLHAAIVKTREGNVKKAEKAIAGMQ